MLSEAIVGGASDWEWADRGGVQKLDRAPPEANGSEVDGSKTQSNDNTVCNKIQ